MAVSGQCRCVRLCQIWVAVHHSCPFGAVASVHAWERVGALLSGIVRHKLRLIWVSKVDRGQVDEFDRERCSKILHEI